MEKIKHGRERRRGLYLSLTAAQQLAVDAIEADTGRSVIHHLREHLAALAGGPRQPLRSPTVTAYTPATARRTLRLTAAESDLIHGIAQSEGSTDHRIIVTILRTSLLRQPQPTRLEIAALDKSTRELNAIGVNLNQVVKRMNESKTFPPGLADALIAVRDRVDAHTQVVDRLIKASMERWA